MKNALLYLTDGSGHPLAGAEAFGEYVTAQTGRPARIAGRLPAGDDHDVIVAAGEVAAAEADRLLPAVEAGVSLVLFVGTAAAWRTGAARDLLGLPIEALRPAPETELILRPAPDHPFTRRLPAGFPLVAAATLFEAAPDAGSVLLETSWHLDRPVVAHTRPRGAGQITVIGLAPSPRVLGHEVIRRLVCRAVRGSGLAIATRPVRVAMIGYGAIGREHAEAVAGVPGLELTLVCDRNPNQRAAVEAEMPGLRTCGDAAEVIDDGGVDLAIVSTPPNTHAEVAARFLQAGKHVVVEKPFCLTVREADRLLELAARHQRVLTVYQNRRWDPDFAAIRRVTTGGAIGDVFHVESFVGGHGHPCDYWHSHEEISGGVFYDWGSHYIDWILNLVPGRVTAVQAATHKRVWHDVTNADQARITMRFDSGSEAEFIHSDIAVALKPKWYILGTRGAVVADWRFAAIPSRRWSGELIEETLAAADALPVVNVHTRDDEGALHIQRLGLLPPPPHPFHTNLASHLLDGEPLAVTAESARRNIAVMEAATESARHGSAVVPVDA